MRDKELQKASQKAWYLKNREKILARQTARRRAKGQKPRVLVDPETSNEKRKASGRAYYEKNKEKILERGRQRYQENKEKILARTKERYYENKQRDLTPSVYDEMLEEQRAYQNDATKKYYRKNKEKIRAKAEAKRREMGIMPKPEPSKDRVLARRRELYLKNKAKHLEKNKRYYAKNKEKIRRQILQKQVERVAEDYTPPKLTKKPMIDRKCEELAFAISTRELKYTDPRVIALCDYLVKLKQPHYFDAFRMIEVVKDKYNNGEYLTLEPWETTTGKKEVIEYMH